LQYFGDGYYKIGKEDKKQELSILNYSIIFKFIFSLAINRNTVNCRRFWLKVLSPASLRKLQN
jgi:hypothetical protein